MAETLMVSRHSGHLSETWGSCMVKTSEYAQRRLDVFLNIPEPSVKVEKTWTNLRRWFLMVCRGWRKARISKDLTDVLHGGSSSKCLRHYQTAREKDGKRRYSKYVEMLVLVFCGYSDIQIMSLTKLWWGWSMKCSVWSVPSADFEWVKMTLHITTWEGGPWFALCVASAWISTYWRHDYQIR